MAEAQHRWPDSLDWWIDAVGGYLTFLKPTVTIGQAGNAAVDVGIFADISSRHVRLRRGQAGVVLDALAETLVNGRPVSSKMLHDQDRIRMKGVEMLYHQPLPWSNTARLELTGSHRLPLAQDGIVLLGESCVLGAAPLSHLPLKSPTPVVLHWYHGSYWIRAAGSLRIDGVQYTGHGPLRPTSEVVGSWGAFRWEPRPLASSGPAAKRPVSG